MIEKQINPHDKFFKEVFSRKGEVINFIESFLPPEIVKNIKLDKLKLDNNSYVDEELKENFADIVYNCLYGELLDKNKKPLEIKIALLFEHKSYQDNDIHLQLLIYMINIWRINKKQENEINKKVSPKKKYKLIPILPIIIYHGKNKWQYKQFHEYFISALFYYLYSTNTKENYVKLRDKIQQLPNIDRSMVTMADILREEGRKDGVQKGIQKGVERTACVMLLEEFDLKTIKRSTKLEMVRILELQKLVKKQGASILNDFKYE